MNDSCMICAKTWFKESEYVCELQCGHFLCLEDLTELVDMRGGTQPSPILQSLCQLIESAGRGNIESYETDPNTRFFRCPECKAINPIPIDSADITRPDELA